MCVGMCVCVCICQGVHAARWGHDKCRLRMLQMRVCECMCLCLYVNKYALSDRATVTVSSERFRCVCLHVCEVVRVCTCVYMCM